MSEILARGYDETSPETPGLATGNGDHVPGLQGAEGDVNR